MKPSVTLRVLTSRPFGKLSHFLLGERATIFMLHRPPSTDGAYNGTSPDLLEACITYAKRKGYQFLSVDEIVRRALANEPLTAPTIVFTLDDGYQDQLDHLAPVLIRHQCDATLFVLAQMIDEQIIPWDATLSHCIWTTSSNDLHFTFQGTRFDHTLAVASKRIAARRALTRYAKQLSADQLVSFLKQVYDKLDVDPSSAIHAYRPATWSRLRNAESQGLHIGSHGFSHRILTSLSDADALDEFTRAQALIARQISGSSRVFCYPSGGKGEYSEREISLLKNLGYYGAVTSVAGNPSLAHIKSSPFEIRRQSFPTDITTFARYCSWLEFIR